MAPPSSGPDLAGFVDAQRRLRAGFGEDCVFLGEITMSFDASVPLDPETHQPYDPMVEPVSSGQASAVVRCNVNMAPILSLRRDVDSGTGAAGVMEEGFIALIADIDDRAAIEDKTHVIVRERRYLISAIVPDGIGGIQRLAITCHEESRS